MRTINVYGYTTTNGVIPMAEFYSYQMFGEWYYTTSGLMVIYLGDGFSIHRKGKDLYMIITR